MLKSNGELRRVFLPSRNEHTLIIGKNEWGEFFNDIGKNVGDNLKKLRRFLFFVGDFLKNVGGFCRFMGTEAEKNMELMDKS